ncbi:MAG TPA: bifunctional nuclease domain-containing protein [Pirellulales bacterium]
MNCDVTGCLNLAVVRQFCLGGGCAEERALCDNHGREAVADRAFTSAATGLAPADEGAVTFHLDSVLIHEASDVAAVYLRHARDGSFFIFTTGRFEAWTLASLIMRGTKHERPLTHTAILNVIRSLGGVLKGVVVEDFISGAYHATLEIMQCDRRISVDVRPSDAVAVAMVSGAPIRVGLNALRTAAALAAKRG